MRIAPEVKDCIRLNRPSESHKKSNCIKQECESNVFKKKQKNKKISANLFMRMANVNIVKTNKKICGLAIKEDEQMKERKREREREFQTTSN